MNGRHRMRLFALTGAMLLSWVAVAQAHAGVTIESVATGGFPTVDVSVVTSSPTSQQPRVWENGVQTLGVQAANLGRSTSVVLAIDRSRSMAGTSLADATAAADGFVTSKPAGDAISVVSFASHALSLTGFSTSTIDADGALRSLSVDARSGTALYDAVVLAARQLSQQQNRGRVLIVVTDGRDVSSRSDLAQAVDAARRAEVAVYPIAIASSEYTPGPLRQLAASTGGTFYRASDSGALGTLYSRIASQLARTWRLSYLTAARPGDRLTLRVTVPGQGAAARDVQVPAGPGGAAASPGPSRLLPESAYRSSAGTLGVAVLVGLLVLLAFAVVLGARRSVWVKQRLGPHLSAGRSRSRRAQRDRFSFVATLVRATERVFGNVRQFRMLAQLIERADVPLRAAELAYIALGAGLVVGIVGGAVFRSVLGFLGAFAVGGSAPVGFVWFKARRRLRAFDDQLPDLLVTLAASLKAGHSFRQGIQSVVDEGLEPASREFKRVLTDTQLGRPMEDSLAEMADRVGSKNFTFVINAVNIQRQVGGSLAALFDMVADTVRKRQQFARRIRALTAMGRLSAYVLLGLPFFLALVLTLINGSFMSPLWHRHIGHMLILLMLVMMSIGGTILKKIVSFRG